MELISEIKTNSCIVPISFLTRPNVMFILSVSSRSFMIRLLHKKYQFTSSKFIQKQTKNYSKKKIFKTKTNLYIVYKLILGISLGSFFLEKSLYLALGRKMNSINPTIQFKKIHRSSFQ